MNERPTHVWVFSQNRRRYAPGDNSSPIWREHWERVEITSETRVSWITEFGERIPKKPSGRRYRTDPAWSEAEVDERTWADAHAWRLGEAVRSHHDPAALRQIAVIIGYEPSALPARGAEQESSGAAGEK